MTYINHPVHSPVLDAYGKPEKLYVIAPIINTVRYKTRYDLFQHFEDMVKKSDAILFKVEVAFGDRPFLCTKEGEPYTLQLRTYDELWHKENQINLAFQRLPASWKYAAWIDADVSFTNPNWVNETIHQLQHYDVVQMFSHAVDLGPNNEIINHHSGFFHDYIKNDMSYAKTANPEYYYQQIRNIYSRVNNSFHPGFAHAIRRDAFDHLGGLMDHAILGAGDHHQCLALIGLAEYSLPKGIHPNYKKMVLNWQDRANKYIKQNVGFVPGTLLHYWHGAKKNRKYRQRWQYLIDANYDPEKDIKRDSQGLYQLNPENTKLRDGIRKYMRERQEDSIDLE